MRGHLCVTPFSGAKIHIIFIIWNYFHAFFTIKKTQKHPEIVVCFSGCCDMIHWMFTFLLHLQHKSLARRQLDVFSEVVRLAGRYVYGFSRCSVSKELGIA